MFSLNGDSIGNVDAGADMEKPRSIAVHAMRRLLFWTDVGIQSVFRARLDGADRQQLATNLDGITAMAIDPQLDLLFFSHGKCIEVIDLNGEFRYVLRKTEYTTCYFSILLTNVNMISAVFW